MAEYNGFLTRQDKNDTSEKEKEQLFFQGVLAYLCDRPAEAFETFIGLTSEDSVAAYFNCSLCCYKAGDYEPALTYLNEAEKLLELPLKLKPRTMKHLTLYEYEKKGTGYLSPMLKDSPKLFPEPSMMQLLRVKADILYALGYTDELRKLLPSLSGDNFENIDRIRRELDKTDL